jgi:Zn-dependent protease
MQFEIDRSFGWLVLLIVGLACQTLGWQLGVCVGLLLAASVLAHEVGHALAATVFGVRVKRLGASFKGGYIVREAARTRLAERLITFAGPATNLLLFLVLVMLPSRLCAWVAGTNLVLAVVNLVPIGPTDGARLLRRHGIPPEFAPSSGSASKTTFV